VAPAAVFRSVLDEIVSLQEAQAAAQAEVEPTPAPPAPEPDIAAWSFVEELLHHDTRFAARQAADEASTRHVADEVPLQPPAIEAEPATAALRRRGRHEAALADQLARTTVTVSTLAAIVQRAPVFHGRPRRFLRARWAA
jgi:hypothetical protein